MNVPFPGFEIEFTKDGKVFQQQQVDALLEGLSRESITDLFLMSHGWNNDIADATQLYEAFFPKVKEMMDAELVQGLAGRSFGALGIYWPSKKFTEDELIPGGGSASAAASPQNAGALLGLLEQLKNDPDRLGQPSVDSVLAKRLDHAKTLVPKLETDESARREFTAILREILDPAGAHPEDGSDAFFTIDSEKMFQDLAEGVHAPAATGGGGATAVGPGGGGAAGLKDLFGGMLGAARRLANFTTYYKMKDRAGKVGTIGLAPILNRIRDRRPEARLHLIGHSFGGRVVTAAADALKANTPAVTVTLLQAAFSHNGLATKFDGDNDGFFRKLVSEKRASGPIVITHTKNDRAVGIAYPLASRIAHTKASAFGDANDPYGGMGRNGAQRTAEVFEPARPLRDLGEVEAMPYAFKPGTIYNLNSDKFIKDHSDICKHEVAAALLSGAAAV